MMDDYVNLAIIFACISVGIYFLYEVVDRVQWRLYLNKIHRQQHVQEKPKGRNLTKG